MSAIDSRQVCVWIGHGNSIGELKAKLVLWMYSRCCGMVIGIGSVREVTKPNSKKPPKKKTSVWGDIIPMQIKPEEIVYLVKEMASRHDANGKADWYTQVGILADRYPNDSLRSFCLMERMQCLIGMMKDSRMKGWSMDVDDPKCILTNDAVFRATALAPMYVNGQRLRFKADEFFDLVLNEASSEGNA